MRKKYIFILPILIFFISLIPRNHAFAITITNTGITVGPHPYLYEIINNEAIITCCSDIDKIPDTIEVYPVTTIGKGAFRSGGSDENIVIPNYIKEIEREAFCAEVGNGFRDITIPKSVVKIGYMALGYNRTPIFGDDGISPIAWNYSKDWDMIIRGYTGTAAETYANQNGFEFIALDDEPKVTTTATTQTTTTTSTTVSTTVTTEKTAETTKATTSTTTSATTATSTSPTTVTTKDTTTTLTTTSTSVTTSTSTTSTTPDTTTNVSGDANSDGVVNVRDAAFIAQKIAHNKIDELPKCADYNSDGVVNIRDAAAIARDLAKGKIK